MGLLLLVLLIPGLAKMARLPVLADRHKFDLTLLTLRAVDPERAVRPFVVLGYRPGVKRSLVDLSPDNRDYRHDALPPLTLGPPRPTPARPAAAHPPRPHPPGARGRTRAGGPVQHRPPPHGRLHHAAPDRPGRRGRRRRPRDRPALPGPPPAGRADGVGRGPV